MSDSDNSTMTEQVKKVVAESVERNEVDENTLAGGAQVTLTVNVGDATTPAEAVNALAVAVTRRGLTSFVWQVEDMETGRIWNVMDGEIYTNEELAQIASGSDDSGAES